MQTLTRCHHLEIEIIWALRLEISQLRQRFARGRLDRRRPCKRRDFWYHKAPAQMLPDMMALSYVDFRTILRCLRQFNCMQEVL